jgi:hypothetical protein
LDTLGNVNKATLARASTLDITSPNNFQLAPSTSQFHVFHGLAVIDAGEKRMAGSSAGNPQTVKARCPMGRSRKAFPQAI